jgi:hypothetical protein
VSSPSSGRLAAAGLLVTVVAALVLAVSWLVSFPAEVVAACLAVVVAGAVLVAVDTFRTARRQRIPVVSALGAAVRNALRWGREFLLRAPGSVALEGLLQPPRTLRARHLRVHQQRA